MTDSETPVIDPPSTRRPGIGTMIGISVLAIIVLAVLAIVIYNRAHHHYHAPSGAPSGPSSSGAVSWWPPTSYSQFGGENDDKTFVIDLGVANCKANANQCIKSVDDSNGTPYIGWNGGTALNFRTRECLLRDTQGYGFVGVSLMHVPVFDGKYDMWNAFWLMSAQPFDLEVDLFEHNPAWGWTMPKFSVHAFNNDPSVGCGKYSSEGGVDYNCGLYLDGKPEQNKPAPEFVTKPYEGRNDSTLAGLVRPGETWYAAYNAFTRGRGKPVSFNTLIWGKDGVDFVMIGYSLSNWQPSGVPTVEEMVFNCDFLMRADHQITAQKQGYHFLINSTCAHKPPDSGPEAYWNIPTIVVHGAVP